MSKKSKNKTVIVSGVTGGLGISIAERCFAEGISVIGITSNLVKNKRIISKLKKNQNLLDIIETDFADYASIRNTCKYIDKNHGAPDIIINNAAVLSLKNIEKFTIKEIENAYRINIIAPIIFTKFFIKKMVKRKSGSIINICSSSSYNGGGTKGHTIYASTKHALLGFSRALDEEVRKYNIRVGTISPAGVSTKMMKNRNDIDQATLMEPKEISDAVMYLINSKGKGIVYEMRLWRMLR